MHQKPQNICVLGWVGRLKWCAKQPYCNSKLERCVVTFLARTSGDKYRHEPSECSHMGHFFCVFANNVGEVSTLNGDCTVSAT